MLEQNAIPSLRQKMISEALDYHQNMNSVVLNRMAKNIQVYENPSGKTDPSQQDLLVEGTIKQRIGEIQTNINKLNQTLSYTANPTAAPVGPVGHGRSEFVTGAIHHGLRHPRLSGSGTLPIKLPSKFSFDESTSNAKYVVDAVNYTAKLIRISDKLKEEGKDVSHVIKAYIPMINPYTSISAKDRINYSETFLKAAEECADRGIKFTSKDFKALKDIVVHEGEVPKAEVRHLLEDNHEPKSESDEEGETSGDPRVTYTPHRPIGKPTGYRRKYTGSGPPEFEASEAMGNAEYSAAAIKYLVDALSYNQTTEGISDPANIQIKIVNPSASISTTYRTNLSSTFQKCVGQALEKGVTFSPEDIKAIGEQVKSKELPLTTQEVESYVTHVKLPQIREPGKPSSTAPVIPSRPSIVPSKPSGTQPEIREGVSRSKQIAEKMQKEALERSQHEGVEEVKGEEEEGSEEEGETSDDPMVPPPAPRGLPGGEPIAPGFLSVVSPDAKSSSKIKTVIDNYLTGIVSSYNTLIDYIEMQQRQRTLTQQQEQLASQNLNELIEPLRLLIANASQLRDMQSTSGLIDYTRVYNVISDLINKISSTPPFQKVNIGLLTESLPIRKDIIQSASFDPEKIANHEYLDELASRLNGEFLKLAQFKVNSQEEANARAAKQREIEAAFRMLTSAGYETTEATVQKILKRIEGIEQDIRSHEFTPEELQEEEEVLESYPEAKSRLAEFESRIPDEAKALEEYSQASERNRARVEKLYHQEEESKELIDEINYKLSDEELSDKQILNLKKKLNKEKTRLLKIERRKEKMAGLEVPSTENIEGAISMQETLEDLKQTKRKYKTKREKAAVEVPKLTATRAANVEKATKLQAHQSKKGRGRTKGALKGTARPHKEADDKFGDNPELEPYLTKYLRPSKHRNKTDDFSSSDESSGSDSEGPKPLRGGLSPKPLRGGKKKTKKVIEDWEIIESQPKAEKGILIEKKTRAKKGMGGKKPVHQARPESDLWFM